MKKVFTIFLCLFVILGIFTISFNARAADGSPDRGDLRCSTSDTSKCQEVVSGGKVTAVKIPITVKSSNGNSYTVTKVAEKTDDDGIIKIHFEASGDYESIERESELTKADVAFLVDYSGSFEKEVSDNNVLEQIKIFSDKFLAKNTSSTDPEFKVAYVKFSENDDQTKVIKYYGTDSNVSWGSIQTHSVVNEGLERVRENLLTNDSKIEAR